jgi:hypothetical protein
MWLPRPLPDGFFYDVFLSYRRREPDNNWVQNVLRPRLKSAGLRVCLDVVDFDLGGLIVMEMERAVRLSRYTVAVLSPDYLESSYTDIESIFNRHLGLELKQRRFLGLLRRPCNLPLGIRHLPLIDLTSEPQFEIALAGLVNSLRQPVFDFATQPAPFDPGELGVKLNGSYEYDFFVIETTVAEAWCRDYLLPELTKNGTRTISLFNMKPGNNRIDAIEHLVTSSRFVLPVLSPEFLNDNVASFATALAISNDLDKRRRSVVPLIFHPVDCPLILSVWVGLDFTDPDEWPTNVDRLSAELRRSIDRQASG